MIDGAHQKDEDFAYFHLPPVPGWPVAETTLFGISCNRQIPTKVHNLFPSLLNHCLSWPTSLLQDLVVTTPDITRSIVQKAVVVLARQVRQYGEGIYIFAFIDSSPPPLSLFVAHIWATKAKAGHDHRRMVQPKGLYSTGNTLRKWAAKAGM